MDLKEAGNLLYLVGDFAPVFGGSHYNLSTVDTSTGLSTSTFEIRDHLSSFVHRTASLVHRTASLMFASPNAISSRVVAFKEFAKTFGNIGFKLNSKTVFPGIKQPMQVGHIPNITRSKLRTD
jgi:hypothetical protein